MSDDLEDQYEPAHDLSVLHRWELLHMIWEPIALGASGRVLSVLFRVLPPGRTLRMSMSAVAREAAVIKSTVARVSKELRRSGILVPAATDGKPMINYSKALDAAIRSVASRPPGERERRLARLQQIAGALGTSVNMKFIEVKLAEYDVDPTKRLPGRQRRKQNPHRVHVATDRVHVATDRVHVATASGARCDPELNINLESNREFNGRPCGRPHTQPVDFVEQVLRSMQRDGENGRTRRGLIAEELGCSANEAGKALRALLTQRLIQPGASGWYHLTRKGLAA